MIKNLKIKTKLLLASLAICSFILPVILISTIAIHKVHSHFIDLLTSDAPRQIDLLSLKIQLYELERDVTFIYQDFLTTQNPQDTQKLTQRFEKTLNAHQTQLKHLLTQYRHHMGPDDYAPPISTEDVRALIAKIHAQKLQMNLNPTQQISLLQNLKNDINSLEKLINKNLRLESQVVLGDKKDTYQVVRSSYLSILGVGFLMYFLALSLSFLFVLSLTKRIWALRTSAEQVVHGESPSIKQTGDDELNDLAVSLNEMLKQLLKKNIALKESAKKIKSIIDTVRDSIITIDTEGKIQSVNAMACITFGYDQQEMQGMAIEKITYPLHVSDIFYPSEVNGHHEKLQELTGVKKEGSEFPLELAFSTLQMDNKTCAVLALRDIHTRKEMEAKIRYQATFDSLTGLPNRLLLHDRLQQAIANAKRTQSIVAVVFLDLDRFKIINDSLGHEAGDELLQIIAKRLEVMVRGSDTVSRQGGDEFVLIFANLFKEEVIIPIIKKILDSVAEPFKLKNRKLSITCSAGISFFPKNGKEPAVLLKNADAAMYRSKELGRNTFQFYEKAMNERTIIRLEMESGLRNAIQNQELSIYYQPLMDLDKEKLLGAEALVRWLHPKRGMILPLEFIPLAEETGLIIPIGEWILKTACHHCAQWNQNGTHHLYVSVNISGNQFKYGDLVKTVEDALQESGLSPSLLELELTESVLIEDTENALAKIKALKSLGVSLAIDDFGTGYSSLSYIRRFPIDKIKIDRSFIGELDVNKSSSELAQTIISLAKNLHLSVLAEGVEKQAQLKFLKEQHCNQAQGFLFSEPLPEGDFEHWLENYNKES